MAPTLSGLANRPLAREGAHALRLRRRDLLILARRGDELFKFLFQLLDQTHRALGAWPVQFASELLDRQLEMRDQRLAWRLVSASPVVVSRPFRNWPYQTIGNARRSQQSTAAMRLTLTSVAIASNASLRASTLTG